MARVWVGTSGWRYPPWRGAFYPPGLAQRRELEYLSRQVSSIEINGSFYSLQRPENYRAWAAETPDGLRVRGQGRPVHHPPQAAARRRDAAGQLLRLRGAGARARSSARCCGSCRRGCASTPTGWPRSWTCCRARPGPPPRLAAGHDERLDGRALTETDADRPLRHALEVRHESFRDPALLGAAARARRRAGGRRLGRHVAVLRGGHRRVLLRPAARRGRAVRQRLHRGGAGRVGGEGAGLAGRGRDAYVYFDNDAKVHAPRDAIALLARLSPAEPGERRGRPHRPVSRAAGAPPASGGRAPSARRPPAWWPRRRATRSGTTAGRRGSRTRPGRCSRRRTPHLDDRAWPRPAPTG